MMLLCPVKEGDQRPCINDGATHGRKS
jgi:hypothetical protein